MKLTHILFGENATTAARRDYTSPAEYGVGIISVTGNGKAITLFHKQSLQEAVTTEKNFFSVVARYEDWLCGMIRKGKSHQGDCLGAVEVASVASSKKFPGAGLACYELFGEMVGGPITSDRDVSTSDPAKKTWAKIETDGSRWRRAPLDNHDTWGDYYRHQGTWPNRRLINFGGSPLTPGFTQDDCQLPQNRTYGDKDPEIGINKVLGSVDAWIYAGPAKLESLIASGERFAQEVMEPLEFEFPDDVVDGKRRLEVLLRKAAIRLFSERYL